MDTSARVDYAVRAMLVLADAEAHDSGPVSVDALATQQLLPRKFLEAIFADLRRAELVINRRGARGGYVLGRARDQISVGDLFRAAEAGRWPRCGGFVRTRRITRGWRLTCLTCGWRCGPACAGFSMRPPSMTWSPVTYLSVFASCSPPLTPGATDDLRTTHKTGPRLTSWPRNAHRTTTIGPRLTPCRRNSQPITTIGPRLKSRSLNAHPTITIGPRLRLAAGWAEGPTLVLTLSEPGRRVPGLRPSPRARRAP